MGLKLFKGSWPDKKFDDDLRTLASLEHADLLKFAEWFKTLGRASRVSDDEANRLEEAFPEREKLDKLSACLGITRHILRMWERFNLSLDQLVGDFQKLNLDDNSISKLREYFHNLESIKRKVNIDYLQSQEEKEGIRLIKSVSVTWNMRAVFEADEEGKPLDKIIKHVPIAIVTIETYYSEPLEEETNKVILQFTKEDFKNFVDVIKRYAELGEKLEKDNYAK